MKAKFLVTTIYLEQFLLQSCGWVKLGEYAFTNEGQVQALKDRSAKDCPADSYMYRQRTVVDDYSC